ncbi:MAG: hypothetical protein P4L50_13470 [Anaerolineaceae bacterium]|nr:hypothetical protein [Alphaproteobacteria bacterium]MDR3574867.1 hypothetical protein [Anaerolineaceae bacterium]
MVDATHITPISVLAGAGGLSRAAAAEAPVTTLTATVLPGGGAGGGAGVAAALPEGAAVSGALVPVAEAGAPELLAEGAAVTGGLSLSPIAIISGLGLVALAAWGGYELYEHYHEKNKIPRLPTESKALVNLGFGEVHVGVRVDKNGKKVAQSYSVEISKEDRKAMEPELSQADKWDLRDFNNAFGKAFKAKCQKGPDGKMILPDEHTHRLLVVQTLRALAYEGVFSNGKNAVGHIAAALKLAVFEKDGVTLKKGIKPDQLRMYESVAALNDDIANGNANPKPSMGIGLVVSDEDYVTRGEKQAAKIEVDASKQTAAAAEPVKVETDPGKLQAPVLPPDPRAIPGQAGAKTQPAEPASPPQAAPPAAQEPSAPPPVAQEPSAPPPAVEQNPPAQAEERAADRRHRARKEKHRAYHGGRRRRHSAMRMRQQSPSFSEDDYKELGKINGYHKGDKGFDQDAVPQGAAGEAFKEGMKEGETKRKEQEKLAAKGHVYDEDAKRKTVKLGQTKPAVPKKPHQAHRGFLKRFADALRPTDATPRVGWDGTAIVGGATQSTKEPSKKEAQALNIARKTPAPKDLTIG